MRPRVLIPTCLLVLLFAVALQAQAPAPVNSVSDTPAATLLLPYFQVNLSDPSGWDTVFSINNASATAVLAHVTLWSDLAVPVFAFNIYLTGYDVQVIDMRDLLTGTAPRTASAGQDPSDTISPHGMFSQDINFASCYGILPPPPIPAVLVAHTINTLTGLPDPFSGLCASQAYGDNQARGYVTVDAVNNCTLRFPTDAGYFLPGGGGDATDQNVLYGDAFYINSRYNLARGTNLVHIHASPTDPATTTGGVYTFYGRYVNWTAADNRQPLSTTFATRYTNGGAFPNGTSLIVWRDPKVNQQEFTCPAIPGIRPSWYPLGQEGILIFDEQEHPVIPQVFPFTPQPPTITLLPFPAATQRVSVGGAAFPVPFNFGWLYLDLNTTVAPAGSNPPADPAASQAFVSTIFDNLGKYSVGLRAMQLDSATAASHFVP